MDTAFIELARLELSHGLEDGDKIRIFVEHGGRHPDGLVDRKRYDARVVDGTKLKLVLHRRELEFGDEGEGTFHWARNVVETAGMPQLPILAAADRWAEWNRHREAPWVEERVVIGCGEDEQVLRRYRKSGAPSYEDDVFVIRVEGEPHAFRSTTALKRLRINLLLGEGWTY